MKPETIDLILSIAEYTVSALIGYASGRWKNILVFLADLMPILRAKLPPVYNAPTVLGEVASLRWPENTQGIAAKIDLRPPWVI